MNLEINAIYGSGSDSPLQRAIVYGTSKVRLLLGWGLGFCLKSPEFYLYNIKYLIIIKENLPPLQRLC